MTIRAHLFEYLKQIFDDGYIKWDLESAMRVIGETGTDIQQEFDRLISAGLVKEVHEPGYTHWVSSSILLARPPQKEFKLLLHEYKVNTGLANNQAAELRSRREEANKEQTEELMDLGVIPRPPKFAIGDKTRHSYGITKKYGMTHVPAVLDPLATVSARLLAYMCMKATDECILVTARYYVGYLGMEAKFVSWRIQDLMNLGYLEPVTDEQWESLTLNSGATNRHDWCHINLKPDKVEMRRFQQSQSFGNPARALEFREHYGTSGRALWDLYLSPKDSDLLLMILKKKADNGCVKWEPRKIGAALGWEPLRVEDLKQELMDAGKITTLSDEDREYVLDNNSVMPGERWLKLVSWK